MWPTKFVNLWKLNFSILCPFHRNRIYCRRGSYNNVSSASGNMCGGSSLASSSTLAGILSPLPQRWLHNKSSKKNFFKYSVTVYLNDRYHILFDQVKQHKLSLSQQSSQVESTVEKSLYFVPRKLYFYTQPNIGFQQLLHSSTPFSRASCETSESRSSYVPQHEQ